MHKRADTRFGISIAASILVFPVAAIAMFAVWFIRLDMPPPKDSIPSAAMRVAAQSDLSLRVETAGRVPLKTLVEPALPRPTARISEPLVTKSGQDNTRLDFADPVEDTQIARSHEIRSKPATAVISEPPKSQFEVMPAAASLPPDAKVESVIMPPVIAAPEAASPTPSNMPTAHTDLPANSSPTTTATIPTEPAVPKPFRPVERLVMLPKPRPQIAVAHVSRTAPLPRPRPIEIGLPRTSPDGE